VIGSFASPRGPRFAGSLSRPTGPCRNQRERLERERLEREPLERDDETLRDRLRPPAFALRLDEGPRELEEPPRAPPVRSFTVAHARRAASPDESPRRS